MSCYDEQDVLPAPSCLYVGKVYAEIKARPPLFVERVASPADSAWPDTERCLTSPLRLVYRESERGQAGRDPDARRQASGALAS